MRYLVICTEEGYRGQLWLNTKGRWTGDSFDSAFFASRLDAMAAISKAAIIGQVTIVRVTVH
jgi:hypothetical protein